MEWRDLEYLSHRFVKKGIFKHIRKMLSLKVHRIFVRVLKQRRKRLKDLNFPSYFNQKTNIPTFLPRCLAHVKVFLLFPGFKTVSMNKMLLPFGINLTEDGVIIFLLLY